MHRIDDLVKCPQCNGRSRVVWISEDGKRVAIRCQRRHGQINRGPSKFGSSARPQTKSEKDMVFLVKTEDATTIVKR